MTLDDRPSYGSPTIREIPAPTAGALRAAVELAYRRGEAMHHGAEHTSCPECRRVAGIIERESGLSELLAVCRNYLAWLDRAPDRECIASIGEAMRAAVNKAKR